MYNSSKSKLGKAGKRETGKAVQLVFKVTQHIRDKILLEDIRNLLNCGRIEIRKSNEACDFTVTSLKEFKNNMIPFFSFFSFFLFFFVFF